jgi:hypothetical protein
VALSSSRSSRYFRNRSCLLGVVQLGGASGLFPKNVIDVFKSLFEHTYYLEVFLKVSAEEKHELMGLGTVMSTT